MSYVDGYLLTLKKKNLKVYKKMAMEGARVWMKNGALAYTETVGEDLDSVSQWGGLPFPKLMDLKKDEVAIFSYITYKNKKHRDQVNAKVHKDMEKNEKMKNMAMPFEMSKMAYGGFEAAVEG
jgi:uncharacterized protein YbaA (DUF1428 family)